MATPTLKYVAPTTAEGDLAFKPEPVEIYGLPEAGAGSFSDIEGTVSGVDGANLQAILEDIATRLAAVETP